MPAATMQQTPAIPPRPARSSQDKSDSSVPKIPPRPTKRPDRSVSPNPARFAPSPLNEGIPQKTPKALRFSADHAVRADEDPIDRPGSVAMPSVGEEGAEYSAVTSELNEGAEAADESASSPEQTRTVADDLHLHAPKPSLPARSAKQRVQAVTRTDSDRAASYGIGQPSDERPVSRNALKKKPSSTFSATESQTDLEDEQGIPEIGQRVPMNPNLGDVQAPSPGPGSEDFSKKKNHHRRHSSRGGPPGSYGLHGHGMAPQDKLDKAYYEKHPEVLEREHQTPLHDRQNDFAMSSNELNKLVRETASRGSGLATSSDYHATPTDEVAFQASEEYTSRISSPRPASAAGDKLRAQSFKSEITGPEGEKVFHVDDPEHPEYRTYGDTDNAVDEEGEYTAPILASDEVQKDKPAYLQQPAVHPAPETRGSAAEKGDPPSRPTSRPTSIYRENNSQDFQSTPLDDVKEYEPLFDEETKKEAQRAAAAEGNKARHYFPSKDVWEDAPNSVHYTTEVQTPDLTEQPRRQSSSGARDRPKTPAHAFAQLQEELAEREEVSGVTDNYKPRQEDKQIWTQPNSSSSYLDAEPSPANRRFPSRDIWEDAPESQLHEATISASPEEEEKKPEIPSHPAKKSPESSERPAVPERPRVKQTPSDEGQKARPPIVDKPKPAIPPRPSKSPSGDSKDGAEVSSKPKPPVPTRPAGSKIAALQAGFMSDLNKRLQLGPQAPKKDEPKVEEDLSEPKEKAPLSDARKGRARGPQRRAPAKSPSAAAAPAEPAKAPALTLSFSSAQTFWSIDPEVGSLSIPGEVGKPATSEPKAEFVEGSPEPAPGPVTAMKPAVIDEPLEVDKARLEAAEEPASETKVEEDSKDEPAEASSVEEKTLVSNTAGESILEATVEKDDNDEVKPIEVSDEVKS